MSRKSASPQWTHVPVVRADLVEAGNVPWDEAITGSENAARLIRTSTSIHKSDREHIVVVSLNAKNWPMSVSTAAIGGSARTGVDAASLLRVPILHGAPGIILAHNHPSGDPEPSASDQRFTENTVSACTLLGLRLLDHLILAGPRYFSFADKGLLPHQPSV